MGEVLHPRHEVDVGDHTNIHVDCLHRAPERKLLLNLLRMEQSNYNSDTYISQKYSDKSTVHIAYTYMCVCIFEIPFVVYNAVAFSVF